MPNAVFNSNLTYLSENEGSISQVFNLSAGLRTIKAGSIAVPKGTPAGTVLEIPFGEEGADARVVFLRNDTSGDLGVRFNGASDDSYRMGRGGVFLHWSPSDVASNPLCQAALHVPAEACADGAVTFVIMGA
jgi:hypothetical protein